MGSAPADAEAFYRSGASGAIENNAQWGRREEYIILICYTIIKLCRYYYIHNALILSHYVLYIVPTQFSLIIKSLNINCIVFFHKIA